MTAIGYRLVNKPGLPPLPDIEFQNNVTVWAGTDKPVDFDKLVRDGWAIPLEACTECGKPR